MTNNKTEIEQAVALAKAAADKFCSWKLPKDFYPDSFISFDRQQHDRWGGYPNSWPTGTNLFTHEQATEMFKHCLADALTALLADHRQQVIEELAAKAGVMPPTSNDGRWCHAEAVREAIAAMQARVEQLEKALHHIEQDARVMRPYVGQVSRLGEIARAAMNKESSHG